MDLKKEKEFIITVVPSDDPEYIKEKEYNELKKYIIKILTNLDKYKDNS